MITRAPSPWLAALLLVAGCHGGCGEWNSAFERMTEQPKYKAYAPSEFFADGRAMRPPPAGTVPIERARIAPNGDRNPLPVTQELLSRGRNRFDIYCAVCHSVLGDGNTIVAGNMQLRPPPSLQEERLRALSDAALFRVATEGYGLMPGYDFQLSDEERWAIVAYVRALQLSQTVPIDSLPPALQQEAKLSLQSGRQP